jgi:crotonobetaine/carnitine-CoA ligase
MSSPTPEAPWLTLGELLRAKAAAAPERTAVAFDSGISLTLRELDERSDRVAVGLRNRGVEPGARVATLLYNCPEQVVLMFACAKLGAIFAPLNVSLGEMDFAHTMTTAAPSVFITEPELLDRGKERQLGHLGISTFLASDEKLPRRQMFDEIEAADDTIEWPDIAPHDAAGMLFTGGTTGLPKAVLRTHFSYMCSAMRYRLMLRPVDGDRHVSVSHLFHGSGQENGLTGPLFNDVPTFFSRWFSASSYIDNVRSFGGSLGEMLGAMLIAILRQDPRDTDIDNRLRALMCGVAGVPEDALQQFHRRFGVEHLLDVYAMTETGMLLFCNTVDEQRPQSGGRHHGWCDVIIADELDRSVEPNVHGEILLRPTVPFSMALGYYEDAEATLAHHRNLWLHTGDLGYLDEEDWLYFVGRKGQWIRRRGENISVSEVEQVLNALAGVVESAVFGVPSTMSEEDIFAVVVTQSDLDPAAVASHCQAQLAYFKAPEFIAVTSSPLPRSAAKGEIQRHVLRQTRFENVWCKSNPKGRLSLVEGSVVAATSSPK